MPMLKQLSNDANDEWLGEYEPGLDKKAVDDGTVIGCHVDQ